MNTQTQSVALGESIDRGLLLKQFKKVRDFTDGLCRNLKTEDFVIQSMPDVSPTKWHLAHTTWFFEAFVLMRSSADYENFNPVYKYLFNSYYVQMGERFTRSRRGLLSRPTVKEVFEYRDYINSRITEFIEKSSEELYSRFSGIIEIGIHHEQQHQELMITDIKHVYSINPLYPVYINKELPAVESVPPIEWIKIEGGLYEIGYGGKGFSYDNETPVHKEYADDFAIASRLVTNREYLNFINDKGYQTPWLWLSDGWATVEKENWEAPLYWTKFDGEWFNYKLNGFQKIDLNEPVCHVSHYEADAFARWSGARLPTEAEWEIAAKDIPVNGNFADSENFHPAALSAGSNDGQIYQMYGDVWEWTGSAYLPYPGFKPVSGALGEYNGKFMSGQMVLKGGSCATPESHIRKTYRNFFQPSSRWQFMGIRLAKESD